VTDSALGDGWFRTYYGSRDGRVHDISFINGRVIEERGRGTGELYEAEARIFLRNRCCSIFQAFIDAEVSEELARDQKDFKQRVFDRVKSKL
jgi:hypothetical protein